jgi:hypothetical protein
MVSPGPPSFFFFFFFFFDGGTLHIDGYLFLTAGGSITFSALYAYVPDDTPCIAVAAS